MPAGLQENSLLFLILNTCADSVLPLSCFLIRSTDQLFSRCSPLQAIPGNPFAFFRRVVQLSAIPLSSSLTEPFYLLFRKFMTGFRGIGTGKLFFFFPLFHLPGAFHSLTFQLKLPSYKLSRGANGTQNRIVSSERWRR